MSAVYSYFALTLVGSQILVHTEENTKRVDIYFPLFIIFKMILLIGWLKVANCIEKPFGTDDTDFQMHHLVARHIKAVSIIIDEFDNFPCVSECFGFSANVARPKNNGGSDSSRGDSSVIITDSKADLHKNLMENEDMRLRQMKKISTVTVVDDLGVPRFSGIASAASDWPLRTMSAGMARNGGGGRIHPVESETEDISF
jgi:hypothetical protein